MEKAIQTIQISVLTAIILVSVIIMIVGFWVAKM